ncbi:MAG TPA: DUF3592 domain-containing protein [Bacteroidales bacterium]|nr:DUF3592 domain-containing protein [Bacteroidales bacterium]
MSDFFSDGITAGKVFQLVGVFFILFSFVSLFRFLKLKRNGIRVKAVVKEIVQFGNRAYKYFPVLEYKTLTGETIVKRSYIGGRKDAYKINEMVEIVYDENHPKTFLIMKGFGRYWKMAGSLIMGIVFILAGFIK